MYIVNALVKFSNARLIVDRIGLVYGVLSIFMLDVMWPIHYKAFRCALMKAGRPH